MDHINKKQKTDYFYVVDKTLSKAISYAKNNGKLLDSIEQVKKHQDTYIISSRKDFLKIYPQIKENKMNLICPFFFAQNFTDDLYHYLANALPLKNFAPFRCFSKNIEEIKIMEKKVIKYGGEIFEKDTIFTLLCPEQGFIEDKIFYLEYVKEASKIILFENFKKITHIWKKFEEFPTYSCNIPDTSIEDLEIDLLQYQDFEIYKERRKERKMDFGDFKDNENINNSFKIPYDILLYIFRFLKEFDHIKMRLVSSAFSGYDNYYWKSIVMYRMKINEKLNFDLDKMN